jgi:hypothetical protein
MISNTRTKPKVKFVICPSSLFLCGNHGPGFPALEVPRSNESWSLILDGATKITQLVD